MQLWGGLRLRRSHGSLVFFFLSSKNVVKELGSITKRCHSHTILVRCVSKLLERKLFSIMCPFYLGVDGDISSWVHARSHGIWAENGPLSQKKIERWRSCPCLSGFEDGIPCRLLKNRKQETYTIHPCVSPGSHSDVHDCRFRIKIHGYQLYLFI